MKISRHEFFWFRSWVLKTAKLNAIKDEF